MELFPGTTDSEISFICILLVSCQSKSIASGNIVTTSNKLISRQIVILVFTGLMPRLVKENRVASL